MADEYVLQGVTIEFMKVWKTLLMLSLAVVLGYLVFIDKSKEDLSPKPEFVLADLSADKITGLRAEFAGGSYEIVKIETTLSPEEQIASGSSMPQNRWVLFFPPGAPVLQRLVNEMLSSLVTLRKFGTISDAGSEDSVDMGLIPPELRITLTVDGESSKRVLLFGKENAITKNRYMQIEDAPVIYVVNSDIYSLFRNRALSLRLLSPINIQYEHISELRVSKGADLFYSLRKSNDDWFIQRKQEKKRIKTPDSINKNLAKLVSSSVTSYLDGDLPEAAIEAFKNPKYRVDLQVIMKDGKEKDYSFALTEFPDGLFPLSKKEAAGTFLFRWRGSSWAYTVNKSSFAIITKDYDDFLSKKLFEDEPCDRTALSEIFIKGKDMETQNKSNLIKALCNFEVLKFHDDDLSEAKNSSILQLRGKFRGQNFTLDITQQITQAGNNNADNPTAAPYLGKFVIGEKLRSFEASSVFIQELLASCAE